MSESALEAPRLAEPATAGDTLARRPLSERLSGFPRPSAWWAVTLALAAVSIALIAWASTRPSYDAYGWLVWGYQTLHGTLDLGGAPSWKPLPFVFTVPFALFGSAEMWLWMFAAVAISLGGCIFAGRIAYRLTLAGSGGDGAVSTLGTPRLRPPNVSAGRHWAALAAGVFAGLALLGIEDYMHYILSVQSDPMLVTFTLAAIDAHLCGRRRLAIVFGVLAALGRPEAWPFLGLYGLWCWLRVPSTRWLLIAGAAVIVFTWFGIPTITNGRPFVSAQLAFNSPRELKQNQVFGTIGRFTELYYLPTWIAALVCVAWAAVRRNRLVLALAAGTAGWVVVEIAFALHGWPGLPRYMFEPAGVAVALAGTAVGWVLIEGPRLFGRLPAWAGVPVVAALVLSLLPGAHARERTELRDLKHERGRAKEISLLSPAIAALGGPLHVRHCGNPVTDVRWVSSLAYAMHMNVGLLGRLPAQEIAGHKPIVVFTARGAGGWYMAPYHLHHHNFATCSLLRSKFITTAGGGNRLIRY